MVRILGFHCHGPGSIPGVGNEILQAAWSLQITNADRDVEKRESLYILDENAYFFAATMENSIEIPQRNKNRTTIWSSDCTSECISEKTENTNLKRCMHPNIYTLFTIPKIWKQPKCPLVDNEWRRCDIYIIYIYIYIYTMDHYSAIKWMTFCHL